VGGRQKRTFGTRQEGGIDVRDLRRMNGLLARHAQLARLARLGAQVVRVFVVDADPVEVEFSVEEEEGGSGRGGGGSHTCPARKPQATSGEGGGS
jgi:hypothetical protein